MTIKYSIRQVLTPIIGSLGVLCAGSTYFWVNPNEKFLLSEQSPFNMTENEFSWYVAVVEVGDITATLPSGFLADRFGRKTVLLMTGPLIIATWILVQLTTSYTLLMTARVLQGLAVGCIFTVTPIYLGEVAGKKVRGMASTLVQTMWYVGTVYQYTAGPYLSYIVGINTVCLAPALVFTLLLCFCPETPRYYILKKDREKASEINAWLFGERADKSQLESILPGDKSADSFMNIFLEFFQTKKSLKSLFLVSIIALTNVTGVTPILSYSTKTFEQITQADGSLITIVMGCVSLVATTIVALTVDRLGRRPLLLFSLVCCTIILLISAFLHIFANGNILQALCIALYPSLMSLGPGTLTYALMAELFSNRHRGLGSAMVTLIAAIGTFLGLKLYSDIERAFGLETNLFILSGMSFFSSIVIYKLMPETKGKTFEEIQRLL